jgi:hypothetical protein
MRLSSALEVLGGTWTSRMTRASSTVRAALQHQPLVADVAAGRRGILFSSGDSDPVPLASEGPKPSVDIQRREALRLYRECLRTAKLFTWPDKDGIPWRDKLSASARKVRFARN